MAEESLDWIVFHLCNGPLRSLYIASDLANSGLNVVQLLWNWDLPRSDFTWEKSVMSDCAWPEVYEFIAHMFINHQDILSIWVHIPRIPGFMHPGEFKGPLEGLIREGWIVQKKFEPSFMSGDTLLWCPLAPWNMRHSFFRSWRAYAQQP